MINLLLVCSDETFKGIVDDCINHYCKSQGEDEQMDYGEVWEMMFGENTSWGEVLNDKIEVIHCLMALIESMD